MAVDSGYSRTPLREKLGIREGFAVALINAPPGYPERLGKLPRGVRVETQQSNLLDFVHLFTTSRSQLDEEFPKLRERLSQGGMLWVSWPKRSSGVQTDVSESLVRETGLRNGLVDVKVASIDETWSGLKFVRRSRDRKEAP